ncbi:MAG: proteasome subunit beta [Myxococcota bacterium]|nr:proteasome subunit beta [Myxococcota bacterium]
MPDFSPWTESAGVSIPHGTTVLAFKFGDGVLVAGDRLATEGHRVASRDVEKVFSTDEYSLMAISGAAGPCIEMGRILSVELEHYEKIEGQALELEGKANKLGQMIRQNLPAAMQGLVVVPLFAGYDMRRGAGRLWKYDITGGRYEETEFEATGSGGIYASESLKKSWRPDLTADGAIAAAVTALTDAADQDRATGGVDLQRKIFPIVNLATNKKITRVDDATVEEIYRALVDERTVGGAS